LRPSDCIHTIEDRRHANIVLLCIRTGITTTFTIFLMTSLGSDIYAYEEWNNFGKLHSRTATLVLDVYNLLYYR